MTERLINIQVHWSEPDATTGARTFLGITPFTRNDDDSDPPTAFVPKAFMNPAVVAALESGTLPALTAARAARIAALEPPEQRAARELEEATAAKAALDAEIAAKQTKLDALNQQLAADAATNPELTTNP
jgi:hypothetical protein